MATRAFLTLACLVTNRRTKVDTDEFSDGTPTLSEPEEGDDITLPVGWGDLRIRSVVVNPAWTQAGDEAKAEVEELSRQMMADSEVPAETKQEQEKNLPLAIAAQQAQAQEDIPEKLYLSYEFSVLGPEGLTAVVTALKTVPGIVFKELN